MTEIIVCVIFQAIFMMHDVKSRVVDLLCMYGLHINVPKVGIYI